MKRAGTVLFALIALILGLAVFAAAAGDNGARLRIPFPFYAGDQLMPAGNYVLDMPRIGGFEAGSLLRIEGEDGGVCQHLLSQRTRGNTADTDFHVQFTKYGDTYFISKVRNSQLGAELAKSRLERKTEREFLKGSANTENVDLTVPMPRTR
ncbi:MAG: hypothetical protein H6Q05_1876 [Acidobacteria bacterium]|nr:hypothetical protein [Acidobacteriota bacterium]